MRDYLVPLIFISVITLYSTKQSVDAYPVTQVKQQTLLSKAELTRVKDEDLNQWELGDSSRSLSITYTFKGGFKEAVQFVQTLVEPADQMEHHPDLSITYNRVTISLTTHDAGGVTSLDIQLAKVIQRKYEVFISSH